MTGFILSAGFGTRLKPITDYIPKALVSVCGVPLLKRVYDIFEASNIKRIGTNVHYHAEKIKNYIAENNINCFVSHEQEKIKGTGGALYFAKDFLSCDEYFCVYNVDIVSSIDIKKTFESFLKLNCIAAMVCVKSKKNTIWYNETTGEYVGTVNDFNYDKNIHKNIKPAEFIGITFYQREFLKYVSEKDFSVIDIWNRCIKKGIKIKVIDTGKIYWCDVGTLLGLAKVHFDFLDQKILLKTPQNICIDMKAKKAWNNKIDKESLKKIGKYSWVESKYFPKKTKITKSIVFSDAIIPENTNITKSIITRNGVIKF